MSGRAPSSNGDTFSESSALMWTSSSSSHRPTHCNLPQPGSFPYSPGTSLSTPTTQHSCLVLYPMPPLSFDSLPLNSNDPPLSAWGLWGHGKEKWLGSLNLLTGERVKEAAKGIITGQRISLNAPMDFIQPTAYGREPAKHEIIPLGHGAFDDAVQFNTQCSTQWDGFRHFPSNLKLKDERLYNGVTKEDVADPDNTSNSMAYWAEQGIVGRGVFVDFYSWAKNNLKDYDPLSNRTVHLDEFLACAKNQNVEFKQGDVLFIRWGFSVEYKAVSDNKRIDLSKSMSHAGMAQTEEVLRWVWDRQFAAVASDSPQFEACPGIHGQEFLLHSTFIAGWGLPIGEIFMLEELSHELGRQNRTSFFLTSEVMNFPRQVASPPYALAIL